MAASLREHVPDCAPADILQAAARCFAERGYAATSIDDVARSLGATKGRIYHYFSSKADLFAAVFRAGMEMNYAAVEPYRRLPGRAADRWWKMAFAHAVQMMVTKPFQCAVWEGVELHLRGATTPGQRSALHELIETRASYGNIFRETIAEARARGDFSFDNLSIANQLMFMTLNSPIFWYSPRPGETRADIEELARQVVVCALRGLGGREEGGGTR